MQGQDPLLLNAFDRHEHHVRPRCGCAQCRRIGWVVLLALFHEGSDCLGCDQFHLVSKTGQDPGPVMGSTARLHNDGAGIQLLKERDQFAPSQLALDLHLSGLVHAVHLKDGLGGVQADHGNAHRGRLPLYRSSRPLLWHTDAVGAVHPICRSGCRQESVSTFLENGIFIYPDSPSSRKNPLAKRREPDSTDRMIRPGFLDSESRQDLVELARDGSAAHRLARRANALVLLDDGMSCEAIARVLLIDDDTIRTWFRLYQEDGIEGLASFGYEGGACRLTGEQQDKLKAWISETLPRSTREIGAWIERECGIAYQGRSGLIALLHRLGMEHRKPKAVSRKLDPEKQAAFIKAYEDLLNHLADDEAVLFGDAVHPTHAVRPVGCWAPKDTKIAVPQTSGRQRLNIHGAIDLETGQTRMLDVLTVDAASTIMLLMAIEAMYPGKRLIHLFVDNASYHHAKRGRGAG